MKNRDQSPTKTKHLDPAKRVIDLCGGVARVSEITGRGTVAVHKWTYAKEDSGTGGHIPWPSAERLLEHAKAEGIDLKPDHFFKSCGA